MPEWWHTLRSYRLDDFLMFSPRAHARLFELVNTETWPWPLVAAAAPALLLVALARRPFAARAEALALGLLALATAMVAEWHFRGAFAGLAWVGPHWAAAFALQALLGAGLALRAWHESAGPPQGRIPEGAARRYPSAPPGTEPAPGAAAARALALLLAVLALAWPLAAPAFGRPWVQAELFGLAPDPTLLGWLAWATLTPRRGAAWLLAMAVPLAWSAFSGLMGAALAAPLAAVLPMAAAAVAAQRLLRARRLPRAPGHHG